VLDQPLIKVILLVGIIGVTILLTRSTTGSRHQAIRRLLLIGFVLLAVVAVLFPPMLTRVAQIVGVGRGADLLLYGLTITFLGFVAASYRRMRGLEQNVTTLAREIALREALHDERHARGEGTGPGQSRSG
jgi:small membrane protein